MNLIEKTAPPPRKLDTILLHIHTFHRTSHHPALAVQACYTSFGCEYFGLK